MQRLSALVLAVFVAVGCSRGGPPGGYGMFRVQMHDAPITVDGHTISHVEITIDETSVNGSVGWTTLSSGRQTFDLLELVHDASAVLGNAVLPAGEYQEIRLVLSEDHTIVVDGVEQPLKVASGESSGIKLKGPFVVGGNTVTSVVLDFDAAKSILYNAGVGWQLKPVIEIGAVTSRDGAFAASPVRAAAGGTVKLDDGASVAIPPGALSQDTVVWVERVQDQPQGFIPSGIYEFGPSGTHFTTPAVVTLPYSEAALPTGLPETGLEVSAEYERLGSVALDTANDLISAQTVHFTQFFIIPTQWYDLVLCDPGFGRSAGWVADGVLICDHSNDTTPWIAAVIDPKRQNLRLRGVLSKLLDAQGPGTDDDVYRLDNLKTLVLDAGASPALAVNTVEWKEVVEDVTGKLLRTTRTGGITQHENVDTEVQLRLSDNADGAAATQVRIERKDAGYTGGYSESTVFGSATTVVWDGGFMSSDGVPYSESLLELPSELNINLPRTAVGIDNKGNLVVLVVGGNKYWVLPSRGMTLRAVYHKLRDFNVVKGLMLDGGGSPQIMWRDTNGNYVVKQMLRDDYAAEYPNGRPIIAALVVEDHPAAESVVDQDDLGFIKAGHADYWYTAPIGYGGSMLYTQNVSTVDNQAWWNHLVTRPGEYCVDAFIPSNHATTRHGEYTLNHADGTTKVIVNQLACSSDWVRLGKFTFNAGIQPTTALSDVTGEPSLSTYIGFDAVRLVPAENAPQPGCGYASVEDGAVGTASTWRLPYPAGTSYYVTNGVGGHDEYIKSGKSHFAVDFGLKDGDTVVAAAAGTVVEVVDRFTEGGCDDKYAGTANRVLIAHPDGTNSLYLHLQPHSVPAGIRAGQPVAQGQVIGAAGHTGYVCSLYNGNGAHLHFQRQSPGSWYTSSLETHFEELGGALPMTGQTLRSQNQ